MTENKLRWTGLFVLILVLIGVDCLFVPAHTVSLWGDLGFTDWVSPLANQLAHTRLYDFGMHTPMPPIPYVMTHLLHPHGAVWFDASLLNFAFQSAMILLLYWALSRQLEVHLVFACALASLPVFLSLEGSLPYNALAQFLVASCGICTAKIIRKKNPGILWFGLLSLLLALLALTKQSTATGVVPGVLLTLLLLPRASANSIRLSHAMKTAALAGLVFLLLAFALRPYVNFSGLIRDVYINGSEPKGGTLHLILNIFRYGLTICLSTIPLYLFFFAIVYFIAGTKPKISLWEPIVDSTLNPVVYNRTPLNQQVRYMAVSLGATIVGFSYLLLFIKFRKPFMSPLMDTTWIRLLLIIALVPTLFFTFGIVLSKVFGSKRNWDNYFLAPIALVFLFGALAQNLSVGLLRITVDNNPIIFLNFIFLIGGILVAASRENLPRKTMTIPALLVFFIIFFAWPLAGADVADCLKCTESWPEISHLAGAKLRPETEEFRTLVAKVKSYADKPDDTVMLLPNDPNLESWFDRPRPKLSCAVIFTDQYWDRFVDRDFERLQSDPPKLIVIGPRNYWRKFSRFWNENRGAERLIDLIGTKLISSRYALKEEHQVLYRGSTDYMDIYIRLD